MNKQPSNDQPPNQAGISQADTGQVGIGQADIGQADIGQADKSLVMSDAAPRMTSARFVDITQQNDGQRVDNFLLREVKGIPKSLVYRWLRKGEVRINKGRAKPTTKLVLGDTVRIPPMKIVDGVGDAAHPSGRSTGQPIKPPSKLLNELLAGIIYEDDAMIVLNKASGIAAHGGTGVAFGVIEALRSVRPAGLELVHRLDRETSGLLLLAKQRTVLLNLQQQLQSEDERIDKRYLTLVCGRWQGPNEVSTALSRSRAGEAAESIMQADADGKASVSHFKPLAFYADFTFMEVKIETGRMHQIRVHSAHTGHAVAGDRKYGDKTINKTLKNLGLRRLFLHAHSLSFQHPVSAERVDFHAPLPENLNDILNQLA